MHPFHLESGSESREKLNSYPIAKKNWIRILTQIQILQTQKITQLVTFNIKVNILFSQFPLVSLYTYVSLKKHTESLNLKKEKKRKNKKKKKKKEQKKKKRRKKMKNRKNKRRNKKGRNVRKKKEKNQSKWNEKG